MKTSMPHIRKDGRTPDQLRPVSISYNVYDFASGSVLFEMGKTKILCAVSLQNGVPPFLRGKGTGWLTAEYALLPMSTMTRTQRESNQGKKDGRSVEIARFIGRCFRSVIDVSGIGEKTITIDCDVLQADGGTRTASITGAFLALAKAQERWLSQRIITKPLIKEKISALSVGVVDGKVLLDLNYDEDTIAMADFNFVITESDKIIEIQGGAEVTPLSWEMFDEVRATARQGAQQLFALYEENNNKAAPSTAERVPLFSLRSRQQSSH